MRHKGANLERMKDVKEKLYTIPINDAVNAQDECPFCFIERKIEEDMMDFVLGSGSSYMESDVREQTDKAGFCRMHFKKMYDYGNTLGNAWILKTHMKETIYEMKKAMKAGTGMPAATGGLFRKKTENANNPVSAWIQKRENSCFICNQYKDHYDRYMDTFFELYKKDASFQEKIKNGKGFCLPHFGDLCEAAQSRLKDKELKAFYDLSFSLMEQNMERLLEDDAWLIEKFDYRNKDADWKNSREALQNCMQKLKGGYPADPVYKQKK